MAICGMLSKSKITARAAKFLSKIKGLEINYFVSAGVWFYFFS